MQRRIIAYIVIAFSLLMSLVACGVVIPAAQQTQTSSSAPALIEVTYYVRVTETRAAWIARGVVTPVNAVTALEPTHAQPIEPALTATSPAPVEPPATLAPPQATAVVVPTSDGSIDGVRQEMLALHNAARAREGLPPLSMNPQLQQAAQVQAEWLSQKPKEELWSIGPGAHIGADGSGFADRIFATGYTAPRQNVNENFMMAASPQDALHWWTNDPVGAPAHRPQIMSALYREVGIGVVRHSSGAGYVFIITFGAQ